MTKGQRLDKQDVNKKLLDAAEKGQPDAIKSAVNAGADVNAFKVIRNGEYQNKTEQKIRRESRFSELEKYDPENYACTALMLAAEKGHPNCVQLLLEAGADVNWANKWRRTALMKAACTQDNAMSLELLIKAGADVNYVDKDRYSALNIAVCSNCLDGVDVFINSGADVNLQGDMRYPPLMTAMRFELVNCTRKLIEAGADVNASEKFTGERAMLVDLGVDKDNYSILAVAAKMSSLKYLRQLLRAGAKIEKNDSRMFNVSETHLHRCFGHNETVLMLLFAAGEIAREDRVRICRVPLRGRPYSVRVPGFLLELQKPTMNLKDMCRVAIREHLLQMSRVNLFCQIPKLGLAHLLRDYLLYGMSLGEEEPMRIKRKRKKEAIPVIRKSERKRKQPDRFGNMS